MKIYSVFAFCLSVFFCKGYSQSGKATYIVVSKKFEENFNASKFDSVFDMFSPEMQEALPWVKTKELLETLKNQVGKIRKREFIKYEQTYAIYKANFDGALLSLNISVDNESKINGIFIKPYLQNSLDNKKERNSTVLKLPFKGEWTVFWGGDTKELNYHVENIAQKNAFDFMMVGDNQKYYKNEGKRNEDYFAFGQEIVAPCDGLIVLVVNGVKDNVPGVMNSFHAGGNAIVLKTFENEYLVFCHLKQSSIIVQEGTKVSQGQVLGLCGNSGNSSEPNLHFHVQNEENINEAVGAKCYFTNIFVNGEAKKEYSPIKGDKIKN